MNEKPYDWEAHCKALGISRDDFLRVMFDRPESKSPEDRTKALDWIAEGYGVKSGAGRPKNIQIMATKP